MFTFLLFIIFYDLYSLSCKISRNPICILLQMYFPSLPCLWPRPRSPCSSFTTLGKGCGVLLQGDDRATLAYLSSYLGLGNAVCRCEATPSRTYPSGSSSWMWLFITGAGYRSPPPLSRLRTGTHRLFNLTYPIDFYYINYLSSATMCNKIYLSSYVSYYISMKHTAIEKFYWFPTSLIYYLLVESANTICYVW